MIIFNNQQLTVQHCKLPDSSNSGIRDTVVRKPEAKMIYSEVVIEIKPSGKTYIKSSMQIESLFLHNDDTYAYSYQDDKVTKISYDGSINQVESGNVYGKTLSSGQDVVYVNKCGDRFVKIGDGRSSKCGHEVMTLRLPPTDFGVDTKRFYCINFDTLNTPPKAAVVGKQLVIAWDANLHVMSEQGTLIRIVPIDLPSLQEYEEREITELKDICGYDQFSVLALFNNAIYQVDIQTGQCKLITHASSTTQTLKCNSKYIFAGIKHPSSSYNDDDDDDDDTTYPPQDTWRILVLNRVSGE